MGCTCRGEVADVCWSRDGRQLASVCSAGMLIVWDVLSGAPVCGVALGCRRVAAVLFRNQAAQASHVDVSAKLGKGRQCVFFSRLEAGSEGEVVPWRIPAPRHSLP
jgi:WD40 repeat protein